MEWCLQLMKKLRLRKQGWWSKTVFQMKLYTDSWHRWEWRKKHKSVGNGFYNSYFYLLKSIKMTLMYPLRLNKENSKIFNSEIS